MIELRNVTKKYHDVTALKDFSLKIPEGVLLVLLGPSGCGKSTVIKLINHLIEPTFGEIFINNQNIATMNLINLRRSIGYVIQNTGLFPHYNVFENIAIVPKLLKWEKNEIEIRVDYLLDLVGLNHKYKSKFPFELSGGEGQRVGVARALAADPPILLMDEPFGSVDPLNRERLQREFFKIQRELKKTVLFVTHDVEEAIRLADEIAIMKTAQLASSGSPSDFITRKSSDYIKGFLGTEFALKLLTRYMVEDIMGTDLPGNKIYNYRLSIRKDSSVASALSLMISSGEELLSVTNNLSRVVGSISFDDILRKVFRRPGE